MKFWERADFIQMLQGMSPEERKKRHEREEHQAQEWEDGDEQEQRRGWTKKRENR